MSMAKLIVGLAGEMGCGKGTATKYIVEKYKGSSHRFSTVLRNILDSLYLEKSRENIACLSRILRENFGEDAFAKAMHNDVENDPAEIVVIDGIRRIEDIKRLKDLPHFKLIYIETSLEKRYARLIERSENSGDSAKTFEQFKKEHELNSEIAIIGLEKYANYVIKNDEQVEDLYLHVDKIINGELGSEK